MVEFEKDEDVSYVIKHRDSILPFNPEQYDHIYTSLNRYERKKNIKLALESMEVVREKYDPSYSKLIIKKPIHILLVIAGGYDERVIENVEYFQELYELAQQYKFHIVSEDNSASNVAMSEVNSTNVCTVHIIFRKSISKLERIALLLNSTGNISLYAN